MNLKLKQKIDKIILINKILQERMISWILLGQVLDHLKRMKMRHQRLMMSLKSQEVDQRMIQKLKLHQMQMPMKLILNRMKNPKRKPKRAASSLEVRRKTKNRLIKTNLIRKIRKRMIKTN